MHAALCLLRSVGVCARRVCTTGCTCTQLECTRTKRCCARQSKDRHCRRSSGRPGRQLVAMVATVRTAAHCIACRRAPIVRCTLPRRCVNYSCHVRTWRCREGPVIDTPMQGFEVSSLVNGEQKEGPGGNNVVLGSCAQCQLKSTGL